MYPSTQNNLRIIGLKNNINLIHKISFTYRSSLEQIRLLLKFQGMNEMISICFILVDMDISQTKQQTSFTEYLLYIVVIVNAADSLTSTVSAVIHLIIVSCSNELDFGSGGTLTPYFVLVGIFNSVSVMAIYVTR